MNSTSTLMVVVLMMVIVVSQQAAANRIARGASAESSEKTTLNETVCADIDEQGEAIVKECKLDNLIFENNTMAIVDGLRCAWDEIKKIPHIKEIVEVCDERYPLDHEGPLCELKIIICTCEYLDKQCPEIKKKVKSKTNGKGEPKKTSTAPEVKEEKNEKEEGEEAKADA